MLPALSFFDFSDLLLANNTLATNPAPPNIRTSIRTHSYIVIDTSHILVDAIIEAIISITESTVNTLDTNEPPVANIHTTPIINGTIIRPDENLPPHNEKNPYEDDTITFCDNMYSPTTSIITPPTNCNSSFLASFISLIPLFIYSTILLEQILHR